MDNSMVARVEDRRVSADEKRRIHRICKIRLLAIKMLAKPNVNRLLELVQNTIPLVRNASVVGEIVLEKAYESLKRGMNRNNNKIVHMCREKPS